MAHKNLNQQVAAGAFGIQLIFINQAEHYPTNNPQGIIHFFNDFFFETIKSNQTNNQSILHQDQLQLKFLKLIHFQTI